jgi:SRSO17 transposase
VAADSVYGVGDIEMALERAAKDYVPGVNASHSFRSWGKPLAVNGTAKVIARALPDNAWRRLSAGEGTRGAGLHDWACLGLADLDADHFDATFAGVRTRGLPIRRNIADGDLAYFSTWCPLGAPVEKPVTVEGHRWAIEDSFETAENEFGLDHNETRSWHGWHGWHRHVSLVMLAFAMMAVIRVSANTPPSDPPKTMRSARRKTANRSGGRCRKSAGPSRASHGNKSIPPMSSQGRSGDMLIRQQLNKHTSNPKCNCKARQ